MPNVASGRDDIALSPRDFLRKTNRFLLNYIFEEAARNGKIPSPDEAIEKMHEWIARFAGTPTGDFETGSLPKELRRLDLRRLNREAHHYAVDLFYDAFRRRKGAPRLRCEHLDQLLRLKAEGLSPRKIAIKVGEGGSAEAKDRIRKRLAIAKVRQGRK